MALCDDQCPDPLSEHIRCLRPKGHRGAIHAAYTKTWPRIGAIICIYCEYGLCRSCPTVWCECDLEQRRARTS